MMMRPEFAFEADLLSRGLSDHLLRRLRTHPLRSHVSASTHWIRHTTLAYIERDCSEFG